MTGNDYPWRVLIVDDEDRDWVVPMTEALRDAAARAGLKRLTIAKANDQYAAERLLARDFFHVVSLDMRLPERVGEVISVNTGEQLARQFPDSLFPKHLIYSQTLREESMAQSPRDALRVARLGDVDQYAKPTGGRAERGAPVPVLSVEAWAKRVLDSLIADNLRLTADLAECGTDQGPLTVLGAYLKYGPERLPGALGQLLVDIANTWDLKDATRRVDAADRFIELTSRLALAQVAVLLAQDGETLPPPEDDRRLSCLHSLRSGREQIQGWNFANYLTKEVIEGLDEARRARNEEAHARTPTNPKRAWALLRTPLQYALDLAAYWVRHPLCVGLVYTRDGWTAQPLAGTARPRRRRPLPGRLDFPIEAIQGGVWQAVWTNAEQPVQRAICWQDWLTEDPGDDQPWWLLIGRDGQGRPLRLDLDSGKGQPRRG